MEATVEKAVFAIAATLVTSMLYFTILEMMKRKHDGDSALKKYYCYRKLSGVMIYGIIPGLLAWRLYDFGLTDAGISWMRTGHTWLWIAGASLIFVSLNLFNSRNPAIRAMYPELRLHSWNPGGIGLAAMGWLVYLIAYEYLFRGVLLISCYQAFGLWPAVVINLALYSALHLQKGLKEALAALPFGALIIWLVLESNSLLPAIILHSVQAISCEMMCIWRNPVMKFDLKSKNQ